MSNDSESLYGIIEYSSEEFVKGWAADLSSPERPVYVQVFKGDELVAEFSPGTFRWDLMEQGYGTGYHGFVYRLADLPLGSDASALRFRFSHTDVELENSPLVISGDDESAYVPFKTSDLTGNRVLVLAPHPDDESFACGGSIALHRQAQDPVKVVFLTDGALGAPEGKYEQGELGALRRKEAQHACDHLNVSDLEFWDFPDRGLSESPAALGRLVELLARYRPSLIYAPSPLEFHPDHRATARVLWQAVQQAGFDVRVAFFELNRPLLVNTLVDITPVLPVKKAACNVYASQLQNYPYTELALGLNRYRALTVSHTSTHAEGFVLLDCQEIQTIPFDGFGLRQLRSLSSTRVSERPLVSVIVRTKDRPALLKEALSSVLLQTYPNIEIVVVNDGGQDVLSIVREFGKQIRLSYCQFNESKGRSAALNVGVREATGKYLNFLDDDDILYPDHVEKLVRFLELTGEKVAYSDCEQARYRLVDGELQLASPKELFMGVDFDRDQLYFNNFIPFMTAIIRRELTEEVGPFDESFEVYEDWDFWIRASQYTAFYRLPGITAEYRVFAEHKYNYYSLKIYQKHRDYWTIENLVQSAWPRIQALQTENGKLRAHHRALVKRIADLEQERAERVELGRDSRELENKLGEAETALQALRKASKRDHDPLRQALIEAQIAIRQMVEAHCIRRLRETVADGRPKPEVRAELDTNPSTLFAGGLDDRRAVWAQLEATLPEPPATVLALGAGRAGSTERFSQNGFQVTATGLDFSVLELVKGSLGDTAELLRYMPPRWPPEAPVTYEAVLVVDCLEYLELLPNLLGALRAFLVPHGLLVIADQVPLSVSGAPGLHPTREVTAALYEYGYAITDVLRDASASAGEGDYRIVVARKDDFQVRSYRDGNERQILDLFSASFGHNRPLEQWIWKYRNNPYGSEKISVALAKDGSMVAHYAGYPCRFYDTTGDHPRTILAYQNGDTMTAANARTVGRGKTSLLYRVMQHHFARFCVGQIGFAYGYNVSKLQRYYTRLVAGSKFFESVSYWALELDPARRAKLQEPQPFNYEIARIEQFDDEWDEFFQEVAPAYGVLVERDTRYLRWRYLERPDADYRLYAAYHQHALVGWSVFRQRENRLVWGDGIFRPEHTRAAEALLAHALGQPEHSESCIVEVWFSANPGWWTDTLAQIGFESRQEPNDLGMVYRAFLEPDPSELFRDSLYYTMGDSDLF